MKKLISLCLLATCIVSSCKKHDRDCETKNITLDVTLKSSETYRLNLKTYGDEDDLSEIVEQAQQYSISSITKASTSSDFNDVYTYITNAVPKFSNATDRVVLKVYEPTTHHHIEETIITINFTIEK